MKKRHSRAGGRGRRPNSRQKRRNYRREEEAARAACYERFLSNVIAQLEELT